MQENEKLNSIRGTHRVLLVKIFRAIVTKKLITFDNFRTLQATIIGLFVWNVGI
jgi:hypothetical protein